jgi:hypothetical protein
MDRSCGRTPPLLRPFGMPMHEATAPAPSCDRSAADGQSSDVVGHDRAIDRVVTGLCPMSSKAALDRRPSSVIQGYLATSQRAVSGIPVR